MSKITNNKKIIILLVVIITLPFMMDLLSLIVEIIFNAGTYVGTFIRKISESKIC